MYTVYEFNGSHQTKIATYDNLGDALAALPILLDIEQDKDNPGCYDAIARNGAIYTIEYCKPDPLDNNEQTHWYDTSAELL